MNKNSLHNAQENVFFQKMKSFFLKKNVIVKNCVLLSKHLLTTVSTS